MPPAVSDFRGFGDEGVQLESRIEQALGTTRGSSIPVPIRCAETRQRLDKRSRSGEAVGNADASRKNGDELAVR